MVKCFYTTLNMTANTTVVLLYAAAIVCTESQYCCTIRSNTAVNDINSINRYHSRRHSCRRNNAVGEKPNFFWRMSRPNLFGLLQSRISNYTPCVGLLQRSFGESVRPSQSVRAVAAHLPTSSASAAQQRRSFRESPRKNKISNLSYIQTCQVLLIDMHACTNEMRRAPCRSQARSCGD